MSKERVYEIAKKNNISSKLMLEKLEKIGIKVKSHMSVLEGEELKKALALFETNKNENKDNKKESMKENNNKKNEKVSVVNKKDDTKKAPFEKNKNTDNKKDINSNKSKDDTKSNTNKQNNSPKQDKTNKQDNKNNSNKQNNKNINKNNKNNKNQNKNNKNNNKKEEKKEDNKEENEVKSVVIAETITVQDLSNLLKVTASQIIMKLMELGVMASLNQEVDFDTAQLVAEDLGFEVKAEDSIEEIDNFDALDFEDAPEDLKLRPPVVTVMGHVDHGKTSLLDAIRNTKVTNQEAGGITQHIGASTVSINGQKIVFLDTPGHEAFTSMRSRGAMITDIAILVVAADDGVMPQTIEAINHAKAAEVPIIVAINKIDKEGANIDRIKQALVEHDLVPEDWGGDVITMPVSAKQNIGIDDLLEMILMVAEMEELKANPNRMAVGTVIEAKLDKGKGPVASIIVNKGTLKINDAVVSGVASGKIRAMFDDKGKKIKKAGPSIPVQILGLSELPESGDMLYVVEDEKKARNLATKQKDKVKAEKVKASENISLEALFGKIQEGEVKDLNLVIKTDVKGTIDAVKSSLEKLSNEEVRVKVIHAAVGGISESDVLLANASNAIIIGFNVRAGAIASEAAKNQGIDIKTYRVIYDAIEDVKSAIHGMLAPKFEEEVIGQAQVRAVFKVPNIGNIAGVYVTNGKITRNAMVRLIRDDIVITEAEISSLKRFKDDAKELGTNFEGGIGIKNYNDIKEGDVIEAYIMKEVAR